jgi:hypothetical protein
MALERSVTSMSLSKATRDKIKAVKHEHGFENMNTAVEYLYEQAQEVNE